MEDNILAPIPDAPEELKDAIFKEIKYRGGGTTFFELMHIDGFKGDRVFYRPGNEHLILWFDMSKEACDSVMALMLEGRISFCQSTPMVYLLDGASVGLPVAKNPAHHYKKDHWYPIVFWAHGTLGYKHTMDLMGKDFAKEVGARLESYIGASK